MDVIEIEEWASPEVKMIELTQGHSSLRWKFRVREFVPRDGDALQRTWLSKQTGNRYYHPVTPYALVSMKETGQYLWSSLQQNIEVVVAEFVDRESTWLAETYKMAHRHSKEAEASTLAFQIL